MMAALAVWRKSGSIALATMFKPTGNATSSHGRGYVAEGQTAVLTTAAQMLPEGTDHVLAASAVIERAVAPWTAELAAHARIARRVRDAISRTEPERDLAEGLRTSCVAVFTALALQLRTSETRDYAAIVAAAWRGGLPGL